MKRSHFVRLFARVSVLLVGLSMAVGVQAQQRDAGPAAKPMALGPQDYIDIQQLAARYMFAIDACTNSGYDFAGLFTDDGEFSISQEWGVAGARRFKGRETLAEAAGGGKGGCRDPKTLMGYGISHVVENHVVTPTPEGAIGKAYVLAVGVGGDPTKIERQGGYEDVYVKTPKGWRFKTRVHVFPNMAQSVQFGPKSLTPQDYVDIQQLVAQYAYAIDNCTNNGYGYADLFVPEGWFAPSRNGQIIVKYEGRDKLAEAALGGAKDCASVPWNGISHMLVNHVIQPSPEGATGKVYLVAVGLDGERGKVEAQGHYEDAYVKTPRGWRFKSRLHVLSAGQEVISRGSKPTK